MKKKLALLFISALVLVFVLFVWFNSRLLYKPEFKLQNNKEYNHDLYKQLHFLKRALKEGAADEMQALFPEGLVFLNALYGLAWCDFAADFTKESPLYKEARTEAGMALSAVINDSLRYNSGIESLVYGAYYTGWKNYLLGKKLYLERDDVHDNAEVRDFKTTCHQIAEAIENNPGSPYLDSYQGDAWPADMVLCIASLAIHDRIFEPEYHTLIGKWVSNVQAHLDKDGLIPYAASSLNGSVIEEARGSATSLMLCFLSDIDKDLAKQQFERYKQQFLDKRLTLFGVREYKKGLLKSGNVDSGPVIWEIGGAASIVGRRAMAIYNEPSIAMSLRNSIEAFGCPVSIGDEKMYLFGQMPMADAFIAWTNALENTASNSLTTSENWGLTFQLWSAVILMIIALLIFISVKKCL